MDEIIKQIEEKLNKPDFLTRQKNGLLLNNYQISVLERFQVPWQSCNSYSSLVYEIEEILLEAEDEELETVVNELQELNYYNEVRK